MSEPERRRRMIAERGDLSAQDLQAIAEMPIMDPGRGLGAFLGDRHERRAGRGVEEALALAGTRAADDFVVDLESELRLEGVREDALEGRRVAQEALGGVGEAHDVLELQLTLAELRLGGRDRGRLALAVDPDTAQREPVARSLSSMYGYSRPSKSAPTWMFRASGRSCEDSRALFKSSLVQSRRTRNPPSAGTLTDIPVAAAL